MAASTAHRLSILKLCSVAVSFCHFAEKILDEYDVAKTTRLKLVKNKNVRLREGEITIYSWKFERENTFIRIKVRQSFITEL